MKSKILMVNKRYCNNKNNLIEKTVLISLMSALSVSGRVIFATIPSIQATSFIIIITGICFGTEIGIMTGIVTAISSSLLLGVGPWTIWQALCWGLMGFISSLLKKPLSKSKIFRVIYGFAWGFLFGWIMNLWYIVGYMQNIELISIIIACAASFYFDLLHALSNAFLMLAVGNYFIRMLLRIGKKYGVIQDDF